MSDLTERIAAKHYATTTPKRQFSCGCGWVSDAATGRVSKQHLRHVAEVTEAAVREQITADITAERDHARRAHQSAAATTPHLAHDYCRWVGHAEALTGASVRIARGGTP